MINFILWTDNSLLKYLNDVCMWKRGFTPSLVQWYLTHWYTKLLWSHGKNWSEWLRTWHLPGIILFSQSMLLSSYRLAKMIGEQFRDKLKQSHDNFTQAMKRLELHHSGRLEKATDRQQKLRKIHAPKVAKLAMESASLRDLIMYGKWLNVVRFGVSRFGRDDWWIFKQSSDIFNL